VPNPFTNHPGHVGETYLEHMHTAGSFGLTMIVGGIACLLHGLFPWMFTTTGSDAVRALHTRMVAKRADKLRADPMLQNIEWVI
jgi:hypothetical protein